MCGIVGYIGMEAAAPILLEGLSKLEYRGYDSAGMAVRRDEKPVQIAKARGKLDALEKLTCGGKALDGNCGIAHTRWATHGEPNVENAHPHFSDDRHVVLVHNGIIENHRDLKKKLKKKGYGFYSDTDTEVAAKLIDYYHKKYGGTPVEAIARSMMRMRGSYALAVLFDSHPGEIYAARKDSPLIVAETAQACHLASDVQAILKHSRSIYYVDNMEIVRLDGGRAEFFSVDEERMDKRPVYISWKAEAAEKGGYAHFMLKEIHEQDRAVRDTIASMLRDDRIDLEKAGLTKDEILRIQDMYILGCGSAYHAGLVMQHAMEELARIPVRAEIASEFRYRRALLGSDTLVVIISQSGETADSIAALRRAKELGARTLAIVNVPGSAIAREADLSIYTLAGPEVAVATTKAYSAQLAVGYVLSIGFAHARGALDRNRYAELVSELKTLPDKIARTIRGRERVQLLAAKLCNTRSAFFIGRGIDYALCMEGSLKLKEVSYIHSEAYAAGELKHGAISLIEDGTLVVGVFTREELFEKMQSNMAECSSRGAWLVGITNYGNDSAGNASDFTIFIPRTEVLFAASLAVVPLQLLAYYVSLERGEDVDKPRNLAKSVTVE